MMVHKIYIADILSNCIDGKSTGHYFSVARNYQEMFGERVVVAGGPIYNTGFKSKSLLQLPYNAGGGGIKGRLKTFANACKLFKEAEGHTLVLQQCTTITTFLCIALFYRCKSKLFLIQYSREGFRSKLGKLLFKLAKHKINGIICPNEMVGKAFMGIPYCIVPDYIYTSNTNTKFKLYSDRYYDFCIVGRLAPEKGVVEVAKILANTKYKLLIAGKAQTESLAMEISDVCASASNIELHLGYVSDEDYYSYLHNSKYAILNYTGEYSERSSGVVFDTLFNGVPVIARRCRSLQFIEDENMGFVYDDIEKFEFKLTAEIERYDNYINNILCFCKTLQRNINKLQKFIS